VPDRQRRALLRLLGQATASACAGAVLLGGCISDVSGVQDRTLWNATLQGTAAHPLVFGSAAAISRSSLTEAGISMEELSDGTYRWSIREGGCDAPGGVVGAEGAYPAMEVAEGSGGSAEAGLTSEMRGGGQYVAEVRESDTDDVVACGAFEERT
jgi:hypothetical protein